MSNVRLRLPTISEEFYIFFHRWITLLGTCLANKYAVNISHTQALGMSCLKCVLHIF